jgi:hypothetical protein
VFRVGPVDGTCCSALGKFSAPHEVRCASRYSVYRRIGYPSSTSRLLIAVATGDGFAGSWRPRSCLLIGGHRRLAPFLAELVPALKADALRIEPTVRSQPLGLSAATTDRGLQILPASTRPRLRQRRPVVVEIPRYRLSHVCLGCTRSRSTRTNGRDGCPRPHPRADRTGCAQGMRTVVTRSPSFLPRQSPFPCSISERGTP